MLFIGYLNIIAILLEIRSIDIYVSIVDSTVVFLISMSSD